MLVMEKLAAELDELLDEETTAAEREQLRQQKIASRNERARKNLMGLI